jgi:hypothetical protein
MQKSNALEESITMINHKRNPRQRDDIRFFTEVHLLPDNLLLVVAIHPLVGS